MRRILGLVRDRTRRSAGDWMTGTERGPTGREAGTETG